MHTLPLTGLCTRQRWPPKPTGSPALAQLLVHSPVGGVTRLMACLSTHHIPAPCPERTRGEQRWSGPHSGKGMGGLGSQECAGASTQALWGPRHPLYSVKSTTRRRKFPFFLDFMFQPPEKLPWWALLLSRQASLTGGAQPCPRWRKDSNSPGQRKGPGYRSRAQHHREAEEPQGFPLTQLPSVGWPLKSQRSRPQPWP